MHAQHIQHTRRLAGVYIHAGLLQSSSCPYGSCLDVVLAGLTHIMQRCSRMFCTSRYSALKTVGEKKAAFNEYVQSKRAEEREEERRKQRAAKEEFVSLLLEEPAIKVGDICLACFHNSQHLVLKGLHCNTFDHSCPNLRGDVCLPSNCQFWPRVIHAYPWQQTPWAVASLAVMQRCMFARHRLCLHANGSDEHYPLLSESSDCPPVQLMTPFRRAKELLEDDARWKVGPINLRPRPALGSMQNIIAHMC